MLYILAFGNPLMLDVVIVSSSGTDVANPAMFPVVFGFSFKLCAKFLNVVVKMYFDVSTIIAK